MSLVAEVLLSVTCFCAPDYLVFLPCFFPVFGSLFVTHYTALGSLLFSRVLHDRRVPQNVINVISIVYVNAHAFAENNQRCLR